MEENKNYHIISTANMYNILVINDVVDVDKVEDLEFEDFDAIFVDMAHPVIDRDMLAIRLASPLLSQKCRYKPFFITQRLRTFLAHTTDVLVDGYANDPNDSLVTQTITEIYANMRRYNFLLGTNALVTHAQEVFRLCRYAISRGQMTFSSEPTPGLSTGYMSIYYNTLWNPEHVTIQEEERRYFHKQLLELGFIRRKRFLEKVHTCPSCHRSHLIFLETCPKCGSSHLKEQAVIHHFRCAHMAPADEYEWDGELRCPKCKRQLQHIGVDYDKPSAVYTCLGCSQSFMYPQMKVLCSSCRSEYLPMDLLPLEVEEYEFTADGIRIFASDEIGNVISQTGFWGHSTMRDYEDYLRQYADQQEAEKDFLLVIRYHIYDPDLIMPEVGEVYPRIVRWMRRLYNYKSALSGNDYYFLCKVHPGEVTQRQAEMESELNSEFGDYLKRFPDFEFEIHSTYVLHPNEDVNVFLQQMKR